MFVLSCHYWLHYRGSVVFYMTKPANKNIDSYLVIYQTVILCLPAHLCPRTFVYLKN